MTGRELTFDEFYEIMSDEKNNKVYRNKQPKNYNRFSRKNNEKQEEEEPSEEKNLKIQ